MARRTNARTHAPTQVEKELAAIEAGMTCPIRLLRDVGYGGRLGDYTNIIDYKASKTLIEGIYDQKMGYYGGISAKEMKLAMSALAGRAERMGYRLSDEHGLTILAGRDNATFTLDSIYGKPDGADKHAVQGFYVCLEGLYPDTFPIPIPPKSNVNPTHDEKTQMAILVDYAVRKIAPLAWRTGASPAIGNKLAKSSKFTVKGGLDSIEFFSPDIVPAVITDLDPDVDADGLFDFFGTHPATVRSGDPHNAYLAAYVASGFAYQALQTARGYFQTQVSLSVIPETVGMLVAAAVAAAAKNDAAGVWPVVNEMLQAL